MEKWEKKNSNEKHAKTIETQRGKKRDGARSGNVPKGAENTIRSKIEDKLTEEKLKDRGSAAHANTPWAPSGPERIEFACGKVPLRALKDGGVRRPGCLVLSQVALLKVFQKVLSEIWEPKASQRERKGTVHNSKWSQNKTNTTQIEPYGDQKGAIRRKSCSKIMPWSVRSFLFFFH